MVRDCPPHQAVRVLSDAAGRRLPSAQNSRRLNVWVTRRLGLISLVWAGGAAMPEEMPVPSE